MSALPFRIGLAGAHPAPVANSDMGKRAACNLPAGDLYQYPNATSTVDATKPVTFTWNTDCAMSSTVDLYLYASNAGLIHAWTQVPFSSGSFTYQLLPKWWNSTTTATLQLAIINSGNAAWMTSSPPGPIFQVTYPASAMYTTSMSGGSVVTATNAAAATNSADAVFQDVSSTKTGGLSKGAIAAAVVVPLIVLAIAVAIFVRFWRLREAEKRKRWSQALSRHSTMEWEKGARPGDAPLGRPSLTMSQFGGANASRGSLTMSQYAVPRHSLATSSVYAIENNMAGAGAASARPQYTNFGSHSAEQIPTRSTLNDSNGPGARQSRISFAETVRPERPSRSSFAGDVRPNVSSSGLFKLPGASKSASDFRSPSGKRSAHNTDSAIADDDDEYGLSPSQLQGPNAFAEAEARRIAGIKTRTGRKSILSLGGSRRDSIGSQVEAGDYRSAHSARDSVDELRDMEATMMARRSVMSSYSGQRSSPNPDGGAFADNDQTEQLENDYDQATGRHSPSNPQYNMPTVPPPAANAATVAYGPDQMLAVYAARQKGGASSPTPSPSSSGAVPAPKKGMRILTGLGKRDDRSPSPTDETGQAK